MPFKQSGTGITGARTMTGFSLGYDTADYGGSFTSYTPPTAEGPFEIRVVKDTNGAGAFKLYIWVKEINAWKSVAIA